MLECSNESLSEFRRNILKIAISTYDKYSVFQIAERSRILPHCSNVEEISNFSRVSVFTALESMRMNEKSCRETDVRLSWKKSIRDATSRSWKSTWTLDRPWYSELFANNLHPFQFVPTGCTDAWQARPRKRDQRKEKTRVRPTRMLNEHATSQRNVTVFTNEPALDFTNSRKLRITSRSPTKRMKRFTANKFELSIAKRHFEYFLNWNIKLKSNII